MLLQRDRLDNMISLWMLMLVSLFPLLALGSLPTVQVLPHTICLSDPSHVRLATFEFFLLPCLSSCTHACVPDQQYNLLMSANCACTSDTPAASKARSSAAGSQEGWLAKCHGSQQSQHNSCHTPNVIHQLSLKMVACRHMCIDWHVPQLLSSRH